MPPHAVAFAVCGDCWNPISFRITHPEAKHHTMQASFESAFRQTLTQPYGVATDGFDVEVVRTPDVIDTGPAHLPATVAKAFRSAENNFRMKDGEDAAAMLYRRTLEMAVKELHPELNGSLNARIRNLATKGLLPPTMQEWADQIRLIGNDGAHEPEGVTAEELKQMRGFTEAFLRYSITVPFEVALRRGQIDEKGNQLGASPPINAQETPT